MHCSSSAPSRGSQAPEPNVEDPKRIRRSKWFGGRGLRTNLVDNVREDAFLEAELLLLAFATGIQDAATYPVYRCFASNPPSGWRGWTGSRNGPGLPKRTDEPGPVLGRWLANGTSRQLARVQAQVWVAACNLLHTSMAFAAAAVQYRYRIYLSGSRALIVIALLAFSSGGQVAMARSLKINEITTAMATSAYVDLLVDPKLLQRHNQPRNRRALFLISLIAGSFAGAFIYSKVNSPLALLISAIGKFIVTVAFFFNKGLVRTRQVRLDHPYQLEIRIEMA